MREIRKLLLTLVCFNFLSFFHTIAEKHTRGISHGYTYIQPQPQPKPVPKPDLCPQQDDRVDKDGTVTNPNENEGRPYFPCIYNFATLEGLFFLANGTYFPCYKPRVLGVLRVGGKVPEGVRITKAVHQSMAVKFPSMNSVFSGQNIQTRPVVAALVTEGFIVLTNTTTPYNWKNNIEFFRATQDKVQARQRDSKLYSISQVELHKSVFRTMNRLVDNAETIMYALNRESDEKKSMGPFMVANIQTFTTPTLRALESMQDLEEDFIKAEEIFGLSSSRFEFDEAERVAGMIANAVRSAEIQPMDITEIGADPQESSRNTLSSFNNIVQMSRLGQTDLTSNLLEQTQEINASSAFNFTFVPPVMSAYCNRPIEIDPRGHVYGGNMQQSVGMGMISPGRRT